MKMSNSSAILTLVSAFIFGLLASLWPIMPVQSSNLPVCQANPGSSTVAVVIGGRTINPELILQGSSNNACPAGETTISVVSLSRTIILSPLSTPGLSGEALQVALAILASKNPSASDPWLLKLEPGNYDISNTNLTMLPYVNLEGSGEGITTISSTWGVPSVIDTAALVAASNSTIKSISIVNSGQSPSQVAIFVPVNTTNARFDHVTTQTSCSAGSSLCIGFYTNGGPNTSTMTLLDSTVNVVSTGNSATSIGFYVKNAGNATIRSSTIKASGNTTGNSGVYNNDGTAIIQNSTIVASGPGSYGLDSSGTSMVGASELSGTTAASNGVATCVASYRANFTPLSSSCL